MIRSDILRGYNDLFVLKILSIHDSYGYQISKEIAEISANSYFIKETTLYSIFARLEKSTFITSYKGEVSKGSTRTYYSITIEGTKYLNECINEWEETKKLIQHFI